MSMFVNRERGSVCPYMSVCVSVCLSLSVSVYVSLYASVCVHACLEIENNIVCLSILSVCTNREHVCWISFKEQICRR